MPGDEFAEVEAAGLALATVISPNRAKTIASASNGNRERLDTLTPARGPISLAVSLDLALCQRDAPWIDITVPLRRLQIGLQFAHGQAVLTRCLINLRQLPVYFRIIGSV